MNLQDKVIVVTGAARGLGAAISRMLAEEKAHIVLVDVNDESLNEAVELFQADGLNVSAKVCDITDEASVIRLFDDIVAERGRVDGLVNNAGITKDSLLIKAKDGEVTGGMSLEQWKQVIDVNLTGVFLCGREAAKHMVNGATEGVIVNISSISKAGNIGQTNYAASKAGVAAMTTTWAKELARYGIRCAAIAPGFIETEMTAAIKPEMLERIKHTIPLRHMGQPDNIAQTVKFIFENDYISGRIIEVDGALRL